MIFVCEHHDAVLALWRQQDLRGIRLAHVDFHDDLRGLLVDRRRNRAWAIGPLARGGLEPDAGDFLAHAVLEGRLEAVRWVHDRWGGRAWDMGIVRYTSDPTSWPKRLRILLSRRPAYRLELVEELLEHWEGTAPGELLSIDWDCFASILQDAKGIRARVERFLRPLGDGPVPADTYVSYSPEYCRPSLDAFKEFVEELGRRFAQPVEWLDAGLAEGRLRPTGVQADLPRDPWSRLVLSFRRRGIF